MNKQNEKILLEKFPNLYENTNIFHNGSPGDGWFNLIFDLSLKIENFINENKNKFNENNYKPCCLQIKEKFGILRYYIRSSDPKINTWIKEAEILSSYTCEQCGSIDAETTNMNGWFKTLCEKCFEKKLKNNKN